ncbi:MAG: invasion associated locus B family protein [Hyphomicrobiaceae bacterium]
MKLRHITCRPAFALSFIAALFCAHTAFAAKLVEKSGDWSMFVHDAAQKKICFIASQPSSSSPKDAKRDPAFFYVSAWPKDGVKSEISVLLGYPVKKGSDVTVAISSDKFTLFVQGDKAFVADPTDELKLIDAMKRGSTMEVSASAEAGFETTDKYSLSGVTASLGNLDKKCQ